jgi:hypothetical protein
MSPTRAAERGDLDLCSAEATLEPRGAGEGEGIR